MKYADAIRFMGLPTNYTGDQLKSKFRELSKRHHPDRPGGSKEMFAMVADARDVLEKSMGRGKPADTEETVTWTYGGHRYTTTRAEYENVKRQVDELNRKYSQDFRRAQDDLERMRSASAATEVGRFNIIMTLCAVILAYTVSSLLLGSISGFWGSLLRIVFYMTAFSVWRIVVPQFGIAVFGRKLYNRHTYKILKQ